MLNAVLICGRNEKEMGMIDPTKAIRLRLPNVMSIAGLTLTADGIVGAPIASQGGAGGHPGRAGNFTRVCT